MFARGVLGSLTRMLLSNILAGQGCTTLGTIKTISQASTKTICRKSFLQVLVRARDLDLPIGTAELGQARDAMKASAPKRSMCMQAAKCRGGFGRHTPRI